MSVVNTAVFVAKFMFEMETRSTGKVIWTKSHEQKKNLSGIKICLQVSAI